MINSLGRRPRLMVVMTAALGVGVAVAGPAASAAPGALVLASVSDSGVKGNGDSLAAALSADGRIVAFTSQARNLDPADSDAVSDVYLRDVTAGDTVLASTSDNGRKGNGESFRPALSADGVTVAFSSSATNLDLADTDTATDAYVKNLDSGSIVLVSTSDTGVKSNRGSFRPALSADGRTVAYYSTSTNLDPADRDPSPDVYVKDVRTGNIVLASTSDTGVKGNGRSYDPALSSDGRTVTFWSFATNLDPGDTDPNPDIYVKDLRTGNITLASTSDTGRKGNESSYFPVLSGDGHTVAFYSGATNLDPADSDPNADIYVKDLRSGNIALASSSDTGVHSNGSSYFPALSADGRTVAFYSSASNLDPADTDRRPDIFVKDLVSGNILLASVSSAGAKSNGNSNSPALSPDGTAVAFSSAATNLDPADRDTVLDVYVRDLGQ